MTDIEQFMGKFSFRKYNQALYMSHSLEVVQIQVCITYPSPNVFYMCIALYLKRISLLWVHSVPYTGIYFLCIFTILAKFKQCCKIGQYQKNRKCTIFLYNIFGTCIRCKAI